MPWNLVLAQGSEFVFIITACKILKSQISKCKHEMKLFNVMRDQKKRNVLKKLILYRYFV